MNAQQGQHLVLMETPRRNGKGYDCLSWYTRPQEEAIGGEEFALQCTIKRMVDYNRDKQLFSRALLVYAAPKLQGDTPLRCYNAYGERIW
jgi:hypothetical protein